MTKTFAIHTLGCKVNQYESQQLRQLLESLGFSSADSGRGADLIVVNSCCVTGTASAKSRQSLRRLGSLNPNATLVLTGCLAIAGLDELQILAGRDIRIVPDKAKLAQAIDDLVALTTNVSVQNPSIALSPDKIKDKNPSEPAQIASDLQPLRRFSGQCRAFLKIQDGCDAFCSYCIIPKIRTQVCNKDVKTVLNEAKNLVSSGHKEIVLSGIFLGAYGQSTARRKYWEAEKRDALADLLEQLATVSGLARIRLSSLEPADVTDRLLDVFVKYSNIMPHLHLPLQSGSPAILKKMCRQYTLEDYYSVVEKANAVLDRPAITTDIIVGFPGETDADFARTLDVAEQIGFAKIHVFPFSARKDTPAARMPGKVNPAIIKTRAEVLQAADNRLQEQFRRQFVGQPVSVLVESLRPLRGRCERYFMVDLNNAPMAFKLKRGDIISVIL
jgi:threonylcarbamoyladenosine tRNA methylthiotransferase MtaB